MNVLVTGASGAIGTALVPRLLERHPTVYCQSRSRRSSVSGETWLRFELKDAASALRDLPSWDLVFHLAGQTSVYGAANDPVGTVTANVMGLLSLLEVLRYQRKRALVVAAGTVTQAGLPRQQTIDESLHDSPVTFYDISKLSAENLLLQYAREGWVNGCCLRLATVYGAHSDAQAGDRGVLDRVVRDALDGSPITLYGEGRQLRDYLHIDDAVEAFVAAADNRAAVDGRAFVVGTGQGVSVREAFRCAAEVAATITGRAVPISSVAPPEGLSPIEFRSAVVDSSRFRAATGWRPRFGLREGLLRSYDSA